MRPLPAASALFQYERYVASANTEQPDLTSSRKTPSKSASAKVVAPRPGKVLALLVK